MLFWALAHSNSSNKPFGLNLWLGQTEDPDLADKGLLVCIFFRFESKKKQSC